MVVTVTMKPTLFRPVAVGIRGVKRADYRTRVPLGSRLVWEPMSGSLDWTTVADLDEFHVRIRYAEYLETHHKSDHKSYDGRRDYRRIPNGRVFGRTICKVQRGSGDHVVRIKYADGTASERIVPESEVIQTVRLFLSVQYIRHGLNMLVAEFEQLGANIVKDSVRLVIRPVEG